MTKRIFKFIGISYLIHIILLGIGAFLNIFGVFKITVPLSNFIINFVMWPSIILDTFMASGAATLFDTQYGIFHPIIICSNLIGWAILGVVVGFLTPSILKWGNWK